MRETVFLFVILSLAGVPGAAGQERLVYRDAPIRSVIHDIEQRTPYRFLYRDALVIGKMVSFEAYTTRMVPAFDQALRRHGLRLQVDAGRHQVLLYRMAGPDADSAHVIQGQVLDGETGARLPFATVMWTADGRLQGDAANEAGAFRLMSNPARFDREVLDVTASYIGYEPRSVRIDLRRPPRDLSIRLKPRLQLSPEVVVSGTVLHADLDTTWHHLLQPGLFSPLGESSVLRSLQSLPAVSFSTAFTSGLNVRGSRSDGFQVLLDGAPIYNQNHFFGLFDAFNDDVLQTVGLYYGIAPADFQAPPGGTLSFVTRTGSQVQPRATLGLSNTAYKGTFEGPLRGGRGSWLVSGRHSYLNAIDWFNNSDLIAQGLDVNRPTGTLPRTVPGARRAVLFPGNASARYYDVHGKLYGEAESSSRWMASAYLGGDATRQQAERLLPVVGSGPARLERRGVETENRWGNAAGSVQHQRLHGSSAFSRSVLAFSQYHSRFAKDDFMYLRTNRPPDGEPRPPDRTLARFENANDLLDLKAAQHLSLSRPSGSTWSVGYEAHHYTASYDETSIHRRGYAETQRSTQADLFAEHSGRVAGQVDVQIGLRTHYFSNGRFLRLSPRLRLRYGPQRLVSLGAGYSRNYQFLHRLSLENESTPDVWVMSTTQEPPGSVDNLTGGLYVKLQPGVFFQVEAYLKQYRNVRLHETVAARRDGPVPSVLLAPWLHDNDSRARGLEFMLRHRLGRLLWTTSYALSRVDLRNDRINGGAAFRAEWDRRHQVGTHVEGTFTSRWRWQAAWLYASGAPNTLAPQDPDEAPSLPAYHRMDLNLTYLHAFSKASLEATFGVYNLYDRRNVWYREALPVAEPGTDPRALEYANVDVYDLGFQPSFGLSLSF